MLADNQSVRGYYFGCERTRLTSNAAMDIEGANEMVLRKSKKSNRVQKRGRTRLGSSTVFPVYKKGKRIGGAVKKRGKKR